MFDEIIGRMILEPIVAVLLKPLNPMFRKLENRFEYSSRRVRWTVAVLLVLLLMAPIVFVVVYLVVA